MDQEDQKTTGPIVKENLAEVTLSQLQTLTGASYRTIKDRLGNLKPLRVDGKSLYYDPKQALPKIYESTPVVQVKMTLDTEKTRLAKIQADKAQFELEALQGVYVPAAELERELSDMVLKFRSKLLVLPARLADELGGLETTGEREALLRKMIYQALEELAKYDPESPDSPEGPHSPGGEASGAAADPETESMG